MGDEHIGQPQFLLQFPQQIHDLDLGVGVQGRDGLVKKDDLRTAGHRPGDTYPLELATGELMGKASGEVSRQAHQLQQPGSLPGPVQPALSPPLPDGETLADDLLDPETGIGGGGVVLKDHAELVLQVPPPGPGAVDGDPVQQGLAAVRSE